LSDLRKKPPSTDRDFAIDLYTKLLTRPVRPDSSVLIREKQELLMDLRDKGLRADQYADFIFFRFSNEGKNDVSIDAIAAKSPAIASTADDREYLKCIERMARLAKNHYQRGSSIDKLVRDMTLLWDVKIAILKTGSLFSYIKDFVKNITSQ
jgi:hypothetical protein